MPSSPSDDAGHAGAAAETPAMRRDRAIQMLELSRAQIQAELTGRTSGHSSSKWDLLGLLGGGSAGRGLWRLVRQRLKRGRVGRVVVDFVDRWWAHHPLRLPLTLAGRQFGSRMPPIVREHPVACLAGAAAVGYAVVHWRHWWWPRLRLGVRRLPRKLLSLLWLELAHPNVQASILEALVPVDRGAVQPGDDEMADGEEPIGTGSAPNDPHVGELPKAA